MIESIKIANVATYGATPEYLTDLAEINFIFGSNGAGKSTIARVIADDTCLPDCSITWAGGQRLQTLVYDRNFVKRNFEELAELPGVFTLGENQVKVLKQIDEKKKQWDLLSKDQIKYKITLRGEDGKGGKYGELTEASERFKNKCWTQKQKYDEVFQQAFKGVRHSSEAFMTKVLEEHKTNTAELLSFEELQNKASTLFDGSSEKVLPIAPIQADDLANCHNEHLLEKVIVGKPDVDIAEMIEKVGNVDWVRQGIAYFKKNNKVCPFCQQETPEEFIKKLEAYFDDRYEQELNKLEQLKARYDTESEKVKKQVTKLLSESNKFLDIEKLKMVATKLDSLIIKNRALIAQKVKEPSRKITLEPTSDVLTEINQTIESANEDIKSHNELVSNTRNEKLRLTDEIWKFLLERELKLDLEEYYADKEKVEKAISSIKSKVHSSIQEQNKIENEIGELEKKTTSIQPTIDDINKILAAFGFDSFYLDKTESVDRYRLLRPNGDDAKETLSEGERSFILFLYFFHLLKGSESKSGTTTDRVVVFDDPVSSLDAEILFVVSSLIKSLIEEMREGKGLIRQMFILTHNVYFHKEVTFTCKRRADSCMKDETFWIVRKREKVSQLECHATNPVKTSYQLLWDQVRNPGSHQIAIQNTLRRILENYFLILGNVNLDEICKKFDGKEKLICRSLFDWAHAGSHYVYENIFDSGEEVGVEAYLEVFKAIFQKTGHENHYNMMMGHGE